MQIAKLLEVQVDDLLRFEELPEIEKKRVLIEANERLANRLTSTAKLECSPCCIPTFGIGGMKY